MVRRRRQGVAHCEKRMRAMFARVVEELPEQAALLPVDGGRTVGKNRKRVGKAVEDASIQYRQVRQLGDSRAQRQQVPRQISAVD